MSQTLRAKQILSVHLDGPLLAAPRTPIKSPHLHVNRLDKGLAFDLSKDDRLCLSVCVVPAQVPVDSPVRAAGPRADGPAAEAPDRGVTGEERD